MSDRAARLALGAYRWVGALAYPVIGGFIALRAARGKEDPRRRHERYGKSDLMRPDGPLVWVHAASIGEFVAVTPLIERITALGVQIILTTGTVTSARLAVDRLGDRIIHQFVPLDLKPAVSRFLTHWKPDLAIFAESELWPMTILELGARRVPQVLVNARMSDRSFASWSRRSWLAEALFENLALVVAQSETDAARFMELGARPVLVSGNMKVDNQPPPVREEALEALQNQIGSRPTWAAISTHDGEEMVAMEVHSLLVNRHRDLLTIVVPRHPDRGDAIEAQFVRAGHAVARRSRRDPVTPETAILLGDTIGEMGLFLSLTEIAFVGKSLTGEGGQNPLEPAMMGAAVLSGQKVQNFRDSYQALSNAGAARFVRDGEMLAGAVNFLLRNDQQRRAMIAAGARTVESLRGSLNRTMRALDPYLHPLVVQSQLGSASQGRRR